MKTLIPALIVSFLLFLDQVTKKLSEGVSLNPEWLMSIQSTINTGSSFGLMSSFPYYNQIISVLSILLLCFLIFKKKELFKEYKYGTWLFIFALAGIGGNLIDRLFLFGVRDFIALKYLFTFNLADFYLTITGIILLLEIGSENKNIKRKNPEKQKK